MDKFIKGITAIAAGGVAFKVVKEIRRRKLEKELYEVQEEVTDERQG